MTRLIRHVPLESEMVSLVCRDHIRLVGLIVSLKDEPALVARREGLRRPGEVLREHVRWEEDILFERTQELLDEPELDALGSDLASRLPETLDFPAARLFPKTARNPRAFGRDS